MGYLNNVTGYRGDLLANRAIAKYGNFALLTPGGLVKNAIPGLESCDATVLPTSKPDASLVDYLVTLRQDDGNQQGFGGEGIGTFLYVISRNITVKAEGKTFALGEDGYLHRLPGSLMTFVNAQAEDSRIFLYKRRYIPIEGHAPQLVPGNASELEYIHYKDMDDVVLLDFLPRELSSDMSMHILSFAPGASHGYTGIYVQKHGAYILSSQEVYNLDNDWVPMKEGDYVSMGTYSLQTGYDMGRGEAFNYIYSKDCSRDVEI